MSAPTAAAGTPPLTAQQAAPAVPQQQQKQQQQQQTPPLQPAVAAAHHATPAATAAAPQSAAAATTPPPASLPPPGPSPAAAAAAAAAGTPAPDSRFEKCGFAKLLGDNGLEYYIKKYEIILGRRSKASNLDVVLGDSPVLSRHHARIVYAFNARRWELHVEGKNGVTVNGALYTPTTGPCVLNSQDLLQAGDHNFYFLLPKQQRKRAPKSSKAATPAASEGTTPQQQQQQQQQQAVHSPRLGMLPGQQQQQQAAAAGLGPAMDGPQLGGSSPGLHGVSGFSGNADLSNPHLQAYNSGPMLAGMTPFGNGTGLNDDLSQQQRGWGSGTGMDGGFTGGLGDLGGDANGPEEMED